MLRHPTVEKLQQLKLPAMARELTEQRALPEANALSFEERLGYTSCWYDVVAQLC